MTNIIRIKAVSECLGIRRAIVTYHLVHNEDILLFNQPHPLKDFEKIHIENDSVEVLGNSIKLILGEDVFFYKNNKVLSQNKEEMERMALGIMLMPLDIQMKDSYEDAIKNGYLFDQWNGEFEYLLGLMYKLDVNNDNLANEWFKKADSKNFKFKYIQD